MISLSLEAVPPLVLFLCSWPAPLGAVPPLVLFLCSPPAPPLAEFSTPQAANNSREEIPMRRPITSPTRKDGFPISEWYIPCSFLCSFSFAYLTAFFACSDETSFPSLVLMSVLCEPFAYPYIRSISFL